METVPLVTDRLLDALEAHDLPQAREWCLQLAAVAAATGQLRIAQAAADALPWLQPLARLALPARDYAVALLAHEVERVFPEV